MASQGVEGEAVLRLPEARKSCWTWYKLYASLQSGARPLVCLHGGPGAGHAYLSPLADLNSKYNIPVVLYDQIGTGNSAHLPEKFGDAQFWSVDLFLYELDNLLEHLGIDDEYDLYGNGWGGMLAAEHAVRQPKGLKHLIIANSAADTRMWCEAVNSLRNQLPPDVQDVLAKHEAEGTADSEMYESAVAKFHERHLCRVQPLPEEVVEVVRNIKQDPTVYHTINGPSAFHVTGPLKDWTIIDRLGSINVPTLVLNGRYDQATDEVVKPYVDGIKNAKWVKFESSSHMPHFEERGHFMKVVSDFLTEDD